MPINLPKPIYKPYYRTYIERKRNQYGDKFDPSDLAPQFIPYFTNGRQVRIEVETQIYGRVRGFIGVTTGWRPCFLLVRTKRSLGSSITLSKGDKFIRTLEY